MKTFYQNEYHCNFKPLEYKYAIIFFSITAVNNALSNLFSHPTVSYLVDSIAFQSFLVIKIRDNIKCQSPTQSKSPQSLAWARLLEVVTRWGLKGSWYICILLLLFPLFSSRPRSFSCWGREKEKIEEQVPLYLTGCYYSFRCFSGWTLMSHVWQPSKCQFSCESCTTSWKSLQGSPHSTAFCWSGGR